METIFPRNEPVGAILFIHSWWGLTESLREFGSSLADEG
jgi:dienelactone hydrolase